MHEYDADFYSFLNSFAVRSARAIVPIVSEALTVASVADFGCGCGAWLSVWQEWSAEIVGVDGPYVRPEWLLIPANTFQQADLAAPLDLGRRFDLVQSLEVAEHLPPTVSGQFVRMLTRHSDFVLFSAAVPGQGGENHVNEHPLDFWRAQFAEEGYKAVDIVRPAVRGNQAVQRWYRCNVILYVKAECLGRLSPTARQFIIDDDQRITDYWPAVDRALHGLVRTLPQSTVNRLARLNAVRAARQAKRSADRRPAAN